MIDKKIAETILSLAKDKSADEADVFLRSYASTSVEARDGKVEAFDRAQDIGVGLRALVGERMGFAFTTDMSDEALKKLAEAAVENGRNSEPDQHHAIPERASGYLSAYIYDPAISKLTEKDKIEKAMAVERGAFATDPRIKRIRKATASFSESETLIMNTNGAEISYKGTATSASIEAVAEDSGESQAGWEFDVDRFFRKLDFEAVGRRAAQKAVNLLGARSMDSVRAAVILEPHVAEEFLSMLSIGFSAESVQKKRSLLAGKLGSEIVSPLITVFDDGLLEGGMGTAPSDDEASPMKTKKVIDKGRLVTYLHNAYTARKDKARSTGNGMRGGFKGVPGVGITNLYITPGTHSLEDLVGSTEKGLQVIEIMGGHTANPISGDFSVGATGFWIEKGRIAYPVREITIAGNILDLMKNVDAVGSDLRFHGRIGSPSLRVRELSIGGK